MRQRNSTKKRKSDVPNIYRQGANNSDLNDWIWDEFAQIVNWDKVTSTSSELKRGVKEQFVWML